AYSRILEGPRGQVDALLPLHPDRVRPRQMADRSIVYEHRPLFGSVEYLRQEEVFHLRGYTSDGVIGLNPIEYQREAVALALAQDEFGARMYSNGAQLGGVLTHPKQLSKPAQDRLREALAQKHAGTANAFKTLVLEEGMEWQQISMRARDAQYLES